MTVHVELPDDRDDLGFDWVCKYDHEECSEIPAGECVRQTQLARSADNVLRAIWRYRDGACTPYIIRWMLTYGHPEGALSVTKRITELRRAGFPIVGGTMDKTWCEMEDHRHATRVGSYRIGA